MGPGTVVGEVGLFLQGQRMASVVTETDCVVYWLTTESLGRICSNELELALALHQFLLRLLAERLTSTSNMLRGFQETEFEAPAPGGGKHDAGNALSLKGSVDRPGTQEAS